MQKGFTLVELSIVLVIVGLLTGGILVAQSMVSTAKVENLGL
jgi:prepilin-type N-terminal cleavage/methylation domain-containing protein